MQPITVPELVYYDGVVVRDGIKGCSNGALYRRWTPGNTNYDEYISSSINNSRWLQIKRVMKLCNNDAAVKDKKDPAYNPAYKYNFIYDVIINNLNSIIKYADLDLCGNETTWGHGGFAEAGTGLVGRIMGKPGVTKGGQIVMVTDVSRF